MKIAEGIHWVGAVDWNIRSFHGNTFSTRLGTSYNSYLLLDEKNAIIDGVYGPFASEQIERINTLIPLEKIDYIIANHGENDHSGSLPALTKLCPNAKIFGTAKCKESLERLYPQSWNFHTVKTGDTLSLGKKSLSFIEAPMLHWPDSMFTWLPELSIFFPNDAFGQHIASSQRFVDECDIASVMHEAKKYYANILWPLSGLVIKKIEALLSMNLDIHMIAPSHGLIWRNNPETILSSYLSWAKNETKNKAVIVYETMWGATTKMAHAILEGLVHQGVEASLHDIALSDMTDIITEMLDAKVFFIGSSTHGNEMLPTIAAFLHLLTGMKPKNRLGAAFGSYGWGGGAVKRIKETLETHGIKLPYDSIESQFSPSQEILEACRSLGQQVGKNHISTS
ncbi:MAG: flavodoxin domain-containing protein [Candidatus Ratteibacteria bacterium]|jgi:anaerobic nitric oxide reductase flavorubredoxin